MLSDARRRHDFRYVPKVVPRKPVVGKQMAHAVLTLHYLSLLVYSKLLRGTIICLRLFSLVLLY